MLSGIGPAYRLRALGIDVTHDAPEVGRNLQDHLGVAISAECSGPYIFFGRDQWARQAWWTVQYLLFRTGPLTTNVVEAGAYVRTLPTESEPDAQLHFMPAIVMNHGMERVAKYGVTLNTNVLRPRSVGGLTLASADPDAPPLIDPNFLAEPDDLRRGVEALKIARAPPCTGVRPVPVRRVLFRRWHGRRRIVDVSEAFRQDGLSSGRHLPNGWRFRRCSLIDEADLSALLPGSPTDKEHVGHNYQEVFEGTFRRLAPLIQARLRARV